MNKKDEPSRAALWVRVSNSDQHLENQEKALIEFCERRSWTVVQTFRADGVSAFKGKHLETLRLVKVAAENREFDVLVIWALDRLTRKGAEDALRKIREFIDLKVEVVSLQEPWLEAPGGARDLFLSVSGWIAQQESKRRSERNKLATNRMISEGRWPFGQPPIGYSVDDDQRLIPNPDESDAVRVIFELYGSTRMGVRRIQLELDRLGVSAPRNRTFWAHNLIWNILRNPVYKGSHTSGVTAPRIVEDHEWERVSERRKSNRRLKPSKKRRYALQGRARCVCGARIRVEHPSRGRGRAVYYCVDRYADSYRVMRDGKKCTAPRRRVEEVEQLLFDEIYECLNDPNRLADMLSECIARLERDIAAANVDFAPVEKELARIEDQLDRLEISWIERRISDHAREARANELEKRRDELSSRLAEASPEKRKELAAQQQLLIGAKDYLRTVEARKRDEVGSWTFSFHPDYAESEQLDAFRSSSASPLPSESLDLSSSLDRILDALEGSVTFNEASIELQGKISVNVPDKNVDATHPDAFDAGGS